MEVVGVRVELPSNTPIVLLRELEGSHRMLPIFIGGPEATAIALALDEVNTPRPMTHDLIKNILDAQGVALARLEITELTNGTFYAEMYLKQDDASMVISARPSDGIALAIRMGAPDLRGGARDRRGRLPGRRRGGARGRRRAVPRVHRQRRSRGLRLVTVDGLVDS